jgi:hypothetical protein
VYSSRYIPITHVFTDQLVAIRMTHVPSYTSVRDAPESLYGENCVIVTNPLHNNVSTGEVVSSIITVLVTVFPVLPQPSTKVYSKR